MLVFAGAGLDSMIKQLVRDALSLTIDRSKGAEEKFKGFISRRLARRDTLDPGFLSSVLASRDPRAELVSTLVADLISQSLQSKDQVFRVASNFDIASTALATDPKLLDRISARATKSCTRWMSTSTRRTETAALAARQ